MNNVYQVLDRITAHLRDEEMNKSVTFGDIREVDLQKRTIFPLTHMTINSATLQGNDLNQVAFNIDIVCCDVVDESKGNPRDELILTPELRRIDNLEDVLNTTLMILNRLATELNRGDLYQDLYQLDGAPILVPFKESYGNNLAGWVMTIDILTANTDVVPDRCL